MVIIQILIIYSIKTFFFSFTTFGKEDNNFSYKNTLRTYREFNQRLIPISNVDMMNVHKSYQKGWSGIVLLISYLYAELTKTTPAWTLPLGHTFRNDQLLPRRCAIKTHGPNAVTQSDQTSFIQLTNTEAQCLFSSFHWDLQLAWLFVRSRFPPSLLHSLHWQFLIEEAHSGSCSHSLDADLPLKDLSVLQGPSYVIHISTGASTRQQLWFVLAQGRPYIRHLHRVPIRGHCYSDIQQRRNLRFEIIFVYPRWLWPASMVNLVYIC